MTIGEHCPRSIMTLIAVRAEQDALPTLWEHASLCCPDPTLAAIRGTTTRTRAPEPTTMGTALSTAPRGDDTGTAPRGSDYTALSRQVRSAGLLARRPAA